MGDDITPWIECDIELNFTGPNDATLRKWTADILRRLADRIDMNEFEDGHYPVTDNSGKKVGEIYFDFSGQLD